MFKCKSEQPAAPCTPLNLYFNPRVRCFLSPGFLLGWFFYFCIFYFFGRTSEIACTPWESTKCPGPVKTNKHCNVAFSMVRCHLGFFQKKRKKRREKINQENHVLRSPLSPASTLALTEQVAPEQARCRIRACVFSQTRSRIVKSSELCLPKLFFIVNSQHGWKICPGLRKIASHQIQSSNP